tara:strand:+ start:3254 stop:4567 length:1314 start_codon:yes stop_codon:yes gene_type:complete
MFVRATTTTKTTLDGKVYSNLLVLLAVRRTAGSASYSRGNRKDALSLDIKRAYNNTGKYIEQLIAKSIGATLVNSSPGHGVIFDNITFKEDGTSEVSETKAVTTDVNSAGTITQARNVKVAGGKGLRLTSGDTRMLATSIRSDASLTSLTEQGVSGVVNSEEIKINSGFITKLKNAKGNQRQLKALLGGKGKAAVALRKNFSLKSSDIRINVTIGNKVVVRSIGWDWAAIKRNPKASIIIKEDPGNPNTVYFNIQFSEALIRTALNSAVAKKTEVDLQVSKKLAKALSAEFAAYSPDLSSFLEKQNISLAYTYDQASVLVSKGKITDKSVDEPEKPQDGKQNFISGAQWTALVQARLGTTMARFGKAERPYLKERTGRFRKSVIVQPNYRARMISYTYNPLYTSLEKYGYTPNTQVAKAIREVAISLYSSKFNIRKV